MDSDGVDESIKSLIEHHIPISKDVVIEPTRRFNTKISSSDSGIDN